jgi:hypothetical protein
MFRVRMTVLRGGLTVAHNDGKMMGCRLKRTILSTQ